MLVSKIISKQKKIEEKHRTLFETMAQGVVYQDADGKIFSANNAAERILGLSLDQMKGRTSIDPRWKAVQKDGSDFPGNNHPAMVALKTGKKVKNEIMGVFNPKHEDYTWININATPQFRTGEKFPYQVYTTFEDITERKKVEEKLEKSQEELKSLTAHLHTVREEEHTLVAHELHDDIGQALSALKMDIYMLEKKLPEDNKEISDQIKASKDLLDNTIRTTRKIYSELRPTLLEHFSIKEVLEDHVETFIKTNKISGHSDIDLSGGELKEDTSITIFRIVQEALNNVKWHSRATTVNIGLKKLKNHYILTIEDDGIGIKEKDLNKSNSFGIIGMKERASFLGGKIEFKGIPDKGTTITVTFPLNPENS